MLETFTEFRVDLELIVDRCGSEARPRAGCKYNSLVDAFYHVIFHQHQFIEGRNSKTSNANHIWIIFHAVTIFSPLK